MRIHLWQTIARVTLQGGAAILAAALLLGGLASPSEAAEAPSEHPVGGACPPGFPYTMTLDDALVRYAGYYTEDEIREGFAGRDANGNGYWCYKTPAHDREYPLVYWWNVDDFEDLAVPQALALG